MCHQLLCNLNERQPSKHLEIRMMKIIGPTFSLNDNYIIETVFNQFPIDFVYKENVPETN